MHTIEITGSGIKKEFPGSIQEMNSKQYLLFIKLFLELVLGTIDINEFKISLVCQLLDIKKNIPLKWMKEDKKEIVLDNIRRLADTMESYLTPHPEPLLEGEGEMQNLPFPSEGGVKQASFITIDTNFTRNPLPKIKNLYGPDDVLTNCTGYEYKEAITAYKKYIDTKNDVHLNELIAVLYREKKRFLFVKRHFSSFNGEVRRAFTDKTNPIFLKKRIQKVSKLPFHVKYGVLVIFQAFQDFMTRGEIEIDGNKINLSVLYEGGSSDADNGIGMIGLFYELAESKVFGTLEDVMNTNIYDILTRVYQLVQLNKKINSKKNDSSNEV